MSLSSFEVKQIAAYIKASCLHLPPTFDSPKLGQWLDAISRSSGFRDWNALSAIAPDVPKTEWGEWSGAFFGFARVLIDGKEATNHFSWHRNNESSRHEIAENLAKSVMDHHGATIRGVKLKYSQSDWRQSEFQIVTAATVRQQMPFHRNAASPIVATSADKDVTMLIWWLSESYTMAEHLPKRERKFSCHSFRFDSDESPGAVSGTTPQGPDSLTDHFLKNVTGAVLPKRTCLYISLLPNGPDGSFVPVRVQECNGQGELTSSDFGFDRDEAVLQVQALNAKSGLTVADMEAIARRYNKHEPYPEEDFCEFSGIYDE
ncbi:hypothetical protein [Rhodoferax bucti]|uniref:hypothetical protein n=1 Tax=Rhodoferax bucti TaxID=2576305 RepID=UPI001109EB3A|nr:hypothetical protein [Rhodoferax bucti]